jgi:hypothetical protein
MGLAELTPSLEAAAAVLDALSLQLAARVPQSSNPRSLSLPPPEALVVATKPANRLQLPTPVPAGTPDSCSVNPARCGKGGGTAASTGGTAFVEPAGRQRYLEALDQGPGERKSFILGYPRYPGAKMTQTIFFCQKSQYGHQKTQNSMLISNSLMPAFKIAF